MPCRAVLFPAPFWPTESFNRRVQMVPFLVPADVPQYEHESKKALGRAVIRAQRAAKPMREDERVEHHESTSSRRA